MIHICMLLCCIWPVQDDFIRNLASGNLDPATLSDAQKNQLLVALAQRVIELEAERTKPASADAERLKKATALFDQIKHHYTALEMDQAGLKLAMMEAQYPEVKQTPAYTKIMNEFNTIGIEAGPLQVAKWYQGAITFDDVDVVLIVFWESWCPHCQEDLPRLQRIAEPFEEQGFVILGLTRVAEPATDESVLGFITEYDIHFPIARDTGIMAQRLAATGVPAAAFIKQGKVIWRATPDLITAETIAAALQY